ncbi:hypothetical protein D9M71_673900 [compost metagenome]
MGKTVAAGLADQLEGFRQARLVDVGQCQLPAFARPAQGDFAAEAGTGAGDHDSVLHGEVPFCCVR